MEKWLADRNRLAGGKVITGGAGGLSPGVNKKTGPMNVSDKLISRREQAVLLGEKGGGKSKKS